MPSPPRPWPGGAPLWAGVRARARGSARAGALAIALGAVLAGAGYAGAGHARLPDAIPAPGARVIALEVRGAPDASSGDAARAIFDIEPGDAYRADTVRSGIKRVFLTGPWADVQVLAQPMSDAKGEGIKLILRLVPDEVVTAVELVAPEPLPAEALKRAAGIAPGQRYRPERLEAAEAAIRAECRTLGYPFATVQTDVDEGDRADYRVRFQVAPGSPARVRHLRIEGDPQLSRGEVFSILGLPPEGPYERLRLEENLARIETLLVKRRHLRAHTAIEGIDFTDGDVYVDVRLRIDAGPRYRVVYEGNRHISDAYLYDRLNERALGQLGKLDDTVVERAASKIKSLYRENGFALATLRIDELPAYPPHDENAGRVLRFTIEEGPRARIEEIIIEGAQEKDTDALVADIWEFVKSEQPGAGLLQRVDVGDIDDLLGHPSGKREEDRPVEDGDEWFNPFDNFRFGKAPVYIEPLFVAAGDRLADLYKSDGFLDVQIVGPEPIFMDEGKALRVRYRIVEGPQLQVSSIRFTPTPEMPRAQLNAVSTYEPGRPANLYAIEETRLRLEQQLRDRGYPFAKVIETLERKADPTQADVVYRVEQGPRVRVGKVRIEGNGVTQDFVVLDQVQLVEGAWFTASAVEDSRQRLLRMGLFSSVSIELQQAERDDDAPGIWVRDVVVIVRERPLFSVETGLGASIEDGPRVFLAGEARNVAGLGIGLRARAQLNYPWFTYGFVYDENDPNNPTRRFDDDAAASDALIEDLTGIDIQPPTDQLVTTRWGYFLEGQTLLVAELPRLYGLPFDTRVHADAVGLREIRPAFTLIRGSVLAGLEAQPFPWWRSAMELEGEASDFDCPRDLELGQSCGGTAGVGLTRRRDAGFIRQTTYRLTSSLDLRDDPFRPHKGIFLQASSDVALGSGVLRTGLASVEPEPVNSDFLKLTFISSGYIPLAQGFTIALSLRGGNIFPIVSDNNYIPLYKRFYLGGTGTVRGFFEDQILPADDPQWPADKRDHGGDFTPRSLGGNFFINQRSEMRVNLIGDLDLGIFLDVGELLQDVRNFQLLGFAAGAGVGIRYNTPVGPFAVDLGWRVIDGQRRLAPLVSTERANVHFSIGYF